LLAKTRFSTFIKTAIMKITKKIAILFSFILVLLVAVVIAQRMNHTTDQIQIDPIVQNSQGIQNTIVIQNDTNQWLKAQGIVFSEVPSMNIAPPTSHKNLSLYLITGFPKSSFSINLQTLDEGLKNKSVVVVETSEVNQLSVKNTSNLKDLFINSGDIVKGGKQDRTLAYDLWVPKNTETSLESFCVEAGRWNKRADEDDGYFSRNSYGLSSRKLKIATTVNNSQKEVWDKVTEQQSNLSTNMNVDVKSVQSESSLQLTLENKDLQKEIENYKKAFVSFGDTDNAIGFAYAINGELFGINYYNSPELFEKLKEKLLTAVFVEAISEKDKNEEKKPTAKEIKVIMDGFIKLDSTEYKVNNSYNLSVKWSHKLGYLIESRFQKNSNPAQELSITDFKHKNWIHRSYLFHPK
jgi:hypothetical protein